MEAARSNIAEVNYTKEGPGGQPAVELLVPFGTRLVDTLKVQEMLARELLPQLSPRGCLPCHSGVQFIIRERFEEIMRVDLDGGEVISGG
jgi:hypothetical protein